ncbi:RICIN domain-containing protein [Haliscomenobacter hydrossis]|nr:RICIN domain-containing protein [Haliscomenobacter hydrossis]
MKNHLFKSLWSGLMILLFVYFQTSVSNAQIASGTYTIQTKLVANKNLDVQNANKAQGTRIHLWGTNNGEAQRFIITPSNEAGYYHIKTEWGLCLGVGGSNPNPGAHVVTWACINNLDDQKWKFINTRDGHYNIQSKLGTYIDVKNANTNDGAEIIMNTYFPANGNLAQRWKLQRISTTTIRLQDINESLCPKDVLQGDREFDGHGPKVQCQVDLRTGDEGRAIYADIFIRARETTHDWSTTERRWARKVYDAPAGKRIKSINSDRSSYTEFISGAAGFQLLFPGADVAVAIGQIFEVANIPRVKEILRDQFGINPEDAKKVAEIVKGFVNNGNTVYQIPPVRGSAVRLFQIVGDTGGPDISHDDNCNDDTRIVKIEFNSVIVILE